MYILPQRRLSPNSDSRHQVERSEWGVYIIIGWVEGETLTARRRAPSHKTSSIGVVLDASSKGDWTCSLDFRAGARWI